VLNIPHYFNIITKPMDLGIIDKKLAASRPAKKPEPAMAVRANQPRYCCILEFFTDLKLVFDNCLLPPATSPPIPPEYTDTYNVIEGKPITIFGKKDPAQIPWASVSAEYIVKSTVSFRIHILPILCMF
jgi:hypothetical protein